MFDAKLALQQLVQSPNAQAILSRFVGAKKFLQSSNEQYVSFQFTAKSLNKSNHCKIKLNSNDTYSLIFGKVGNKQDPVAKEMGLKVMMPYYNEIETIEYVYFDQLKEIFEEKTGLYLSL